MVILEMKKTVREIKQSSNVLDLLELMKELWIRRQVNIQNEAGRN